MCCKIKLHKALCFMGVVLHLTVLPLFIHTVCKRYILGELEVFLALLVLFIAPMLVVNLVSAILILREEDFTGRFIAQNVCVLSHCFQMGLPWRLCKLFLSYNNRKMLELSLLIVGQSASSFLPALLFEGYLLKPVLETITPITEAFFAVCMISSSLSFVLAQIGFKSVHDGTEDKTGGKFLLLTACHISGVQCLFISRCLSIILFSYTLTYWVAVLLGLHFLLCLGASLVYTHLQLKKLNFLCILQQTGLMCLHVYDSVTTGPGLGKCANVLYYTLVVVENILMSAAWVMSSSQADVTKLVTVMVMLGTFVLGVVLKFLCYSCDDDMSAADDSDRKTLDVMAASRSSLHQRSQRSHREGHQSPNSRSLEEPHAVHNTEISSTMATVSAKVTNKTKNSYHSSGSGTQRPRSQSNSADHSERSHTPQSYHNPAFDNSEVAVSVNRPEGDITHLETCRQVSGRTTSKPACTDADLGRSFKKAKSSRAVLKAQRGYCSEEQTDIGSSNSRNTNTLDVSAHSNHVVNNSPRESGQYSANITGQITHTWRANPVETKAALTITSPYHERQLRQQNCVPLTSQHRWSNSASGNSCYRNTASVVRNQWYIPPRHFDQCSCDLYTDTTSYYDSLSYYYTVTSTHSSSDSDFAQTWPPSQPTGLQNNGAQLPDEKLSPEERISIWFQRSKQYFSQDILKVTVPQQTSTASSRFGSNRRTFAGYKSKVSCPMNPTKRAPPRVVKPPLTNNPPLRPRKPTFCDEYRVQFQTYMDSLKRRKQSEGWTRYPHPWEFPPKVKPGLPRTTDCRLNDGRGQIRDSFVRPEIEKCDQGVKPPRPPRPPRHRDIAPLREKRRADKPKDILPPPRTGYLESIV